MNSQVPARIGRLGSETLGLIYGFIGVLCFSLTLPATRAAVADLNPTIVGLGRALVAAVLAAVLLAVSGWPAPSRAQFKSLFVVAAGVVVGFPLLSSWAIQQVPAAHGAIVVGLLPLATAIAGVLRAGERPSRRFWISSCAGSATIVAFALVTGGGRAHIADLILVFAVAACGLGYAEGGRLARELGSAPVICWALVVAAPFLVIPAALAAQKHGVAASPGAWLGFAYVSAVSMFLGFFAWYHGLSLGGIARVGQVQLLQPFLTIFASAFLLNEKITFVTVAFALAVVACVASGRKAAVKRPS